MRISKITGVPISEVELDEIYPVYYGAPYSSPEGYHFYTKYCGIDFSALQFAKPEEKELMIRKVIENNQSIFQLIDLVSNEVLSSSYGIFLPTYTQILQNIKAQTGRGEEHNSLLVGALTMDTVVEYLASVQSVFAES
ncbi:MAG: hypothetical protein WAU07_03145, partial [Microgenomates group bacterium]